MSVCGQEILNIQNSFKSKMLVTIYALCPQSLWPNCRSCHFLIDCSWTSFGNSPKICWYATLSQPPICSPPRGMSDLAAAHMLMKTMRNHVIRIMLHAVRMTMAMPTQLSECGRIWLRRYCALIQNT